MAGHEGGAESRRHGTPELMRGVHLDSFPGTDDRIGLVHVEGNGAAGGGDSQLIFAESGAAPHLRPRLAPTYHPRPPPTPVERHGVMPARGGA